MRYASVMLCGVLAVASQAMAETNQAPIANDYVWVIPPNPMAGQQFTLNETTLLAIDQSGPPGSGEGGQTIVVFGLGTASVGLVSRAGGVITYTLPADMTTFHHAATFTYTIQDNGTTNGISDPLTAQATVTVTDPLPPTVTTPTSGSITQTTAVLGGNVTSDGFSAVTERGVVYALTATNSDPTIGGVGVTKVATGGTTGVFTVPVTGLLPGTGYSFKAYATNIVGTGYTTPASTFNSLVDPIPAVAGVGRAALAILLALAGLAALRRAV